MKVFLVCDGVDVLNHTLVNRWLLECSSRSYKVTEVVKVSWQLLAHQRPML